MKRFQFGKMHGVSPLAGRKRCGPRGWQRHEAATPIGQPLRWAVWRSMFVRVGWAETNTLEPSGRACGVVANWHRRNATVGATAGLAGQINYRLSSMNWFSCALVRAPTLVAASAPPLNNIKVGMPRMPNCAGTVRFSSTFILAT